MCVSRVLRMFLHATVACGTELPDVLGIKIHVAVYVCPEHLVALGNSTSFHVRKLS